MAVIVDRGLPNAANDVFPGSRPFNNLVASLPLSFTIPPWHLVCSIYLTRPGSSYLGFGISCDRYGPGVLCCSAGDDLSSPGAESLRCSCLRCGLTIDNSISSKTNVSVANLLE